MPLGVGSAEQWSKSSIEVREGFGIMLSGTINVSGFSESDSHVCTTIYGMALSAIVDVVHSAPLMPKRAAR